MFAGMKADPYSKSRIPSLLPMILLLALVSASRAQEIDFPPRVEVDRGLPPFAFKGETFTVNLISMPYAGGSPPWTVREQPPAGWTVSVGPDATIDPNTHEIVWGPFDGSIPLQRILTYKVTAPDALTTETFQGIIITNNASTAVSGQSSITVIEPPAPAPPSVQFLSPQSGSAVHFGSQFVNDWTLLWHAEVSDINGDLRNIQFQDNGAVFKEWTVAPHPSAMTKTNVLYVVWTTTVAGPHTLTVRAVDALGAVTDVSSTIQVVLDRPGITVWREFPAFARPGETIPVKLTVLPTPGASAWTLKETPAEGWSAIVGSDATVDPTTHEITWGPFTDNPELPRTFTYQVTSPPGSSHLSFHGGAVMNNETFGTIETSSVRWVPDLAVRTVDQNHIAINLSLPPEHAFFIETTDSIASNNWTLLTSVTVVPWPLEVGPLKVQDNQKFYRFRYQE